MRTEITDQFAESVAVEETGFPVSPKPVAIVKVSAPFLPLFRHHLVVLLARSVLTQLSCIVVLLKPKFLFLKMI